MKKIIIFTFIFLSFFIYVINFYKFENEKENKIIIDKTFKKNIYFSSSHFEENKKNFTNSRFC